MIHSKFTPLALVLVAAPSLAAAQSQPDPANLQGIEEVNLVLDDGDEAGEVDTALIDDQGNLVALAVEVGGVLDIGEETKIVPMDALSFEGGNFVTTMSEDELGNLQEWDD